MNNSTILNLLINLMQVNLLNTVKFVNDNNSLSNEYLCVQFVDFIIMPSEINNNSLLNVNFKVAVISDINSIKNCVNYLITSTLNQERNSRTTTFYDLSNSHGRVSGLNIKQIVMICLCSLILGGVAVAAATLRLRYYCKRRRIQTKEETHGYAFGSRCSFGEIGVEHERRLNVSRSLNYPTLEIYPNTFYQTVQDMETPLVHQTKVPVHTHTIDANVNKSLYSFAIKHSPILNSHHSVSDIQRLHRAYMQPLYKKQKRHSLTNKIDSVMIKHFQKTGITPHRNYNRINSKRSESIDISKLINWENQNMKKKTKNHLKCTRSCSERLNCLVK